MLERPGFEGVVVMTVGIYLMTNTVTGDRYVGLSKQIEQRWQMHRSQLERGIHKNEFLLHLAQEHGVSSFQFEILEVYPQEGRFSSVNGLKLKQIERAWIEKLNPSINLNKTNLGRRRLQEAWTEERRQRMSTLMNDFWQRRREKR